MALPIDQLITPLTADRVKSSLYNLLSATGLPVTSWQQGAVTRTIVAVVSNLFAGFTQVMSAAIKGGLLDLSDGVWLTYLAKAVYDVDRITATFAAGSVHLVNGAGGSFTFAARSFICRNPTTNKNYTNLSAFTLGPMGTADVNVEAVEIGAASTSAPGTITDIVTSMLGVSCSNPAPLVGLDEETDPALRQRCKDSLGALSPNGPKAAYRYVAKSATRPDGSNVGVTRVQVAPPPGDGTLTVYVAGAGGPIPGPDLAIVNAAIQAQAVPDGITEMTLNASPVTVAPTVDIWIYSAANLSDAQVKQLAADAMAAYIDGLPIGGTVIPPADGKVSWRGLEKAAEDISPFVIEAQLTPEADIPIAVGEVAVSNISSASVTVHQVVGP